MWFKQLKVFRYQIAEPLVAETVEEEMKLKALQTCPRSQYSSMGWVSPFGRGSEVLLHATGRYWLMNFGKQDRILPASVIKEKLEERIEEIKQQQDRQVYAKEKASLRDEIESQLLPQAFTKSQQVLIYLDIKEELLFVSATNASLCQKVIELLNTTLGGFKATEIEVERDVSSVMTQWLTDNRWPKGFVIERDCEMFDQQHEKNKVRFTEQNLAESEVVEHLLKGKRLAKLSLSWQDKISFAVDCDLTISRIKFLEMMEEQRDQQFCDTKAQQIDADFTLMALEFSAWLPELWALFAKETLPSYESKPQLETA
jgi:recombination associated protein RdgC